MIPRKIVSVAFCLLLFACAAERDPRTQYSPINPLPGLVKSARESVVRIAVIVESANKKPELRIVGTGFIVGLDGSILTARHVVGPYSSDAIVIALPPDRDTADIKKDRVSFLKSDPDHDLALLKSESLTGIQPLKISSTLNIQDGEDGLVMGYPLGNPVLTCSKAMIAARFQAPLKGSNVSSKQIKVDAAINVGNSGGPLISLTTGEVIGMINQREGALSERLKIFKESSASADVCAGELCLVATLKETISDMDRYIHLGIGYAISSEHISDFLAGK